MKLFISQPSQNDYINDIIDTMSSGYSWANSVGIGFTAFMLAIALLAFLFSKV